MSDGWATVISVLGAITALGSMLAIFYKSRNESRNASLISKASLDERIDTRVAKQLEEAWKKIDELETQVDNLEKRESKRNGAITRILNDIARQWPTAEGPMLNPADIMEIEETIPSSWIRKATEPK